MAKTGKTKQQDTERNAEGNRILFCADCKRECTVGTLGGPATTDVDDVTRCWKCDRIAGAKRARLQAAAQDLLAACKAALRKVNGRNVMGEQVEPRLVAKLRAAIAKAEGR